MADATQFDLLEIFDDRSATKSMPMPMPITGQLPVERRHACLGDPILANAIRDWLAHKNQRLTLTDKLIRKRAAATVAAVNADSAELNKGLNRPPNTEKIPHKPGRGNSNQLSISSE